MSQGLIVYLVPRDEVMAALGSGVSTLVTDIVDQFADDIEQLDSDFETDNPDVWNGPTAAEAVAELIDGRPSMTEDDAGLYTAAFDLVCRYYGEWAGNDHFSPCGLGWFERVDAVLAHGGVRLSLGRLWWNPLPIAAPVSRLLEYGHWPADVMRAATAPLDRLLPSVPDAEVRAALDTVAGWLRAAEAAPSSILVGFLR